MRRVIAIGGALLLITVVGARDKPMPATTSSAWPRSFVTRVEALALLQTLNAELLTHDSATLTLERWCDRHHLAHPATVVADRVFDVDKPATLVQREVLRVGLTEPIKYRRVRLRCGAVVLSEADNWYVPARLTPAMNAMLDTSQTPFGKAVQALHFQRRTLTSTVLWWPLPEGWEMSAAAAHDDFPATVMPAYLLRHTAVLATPDGTPFSEVVESYTNQVLGFPPVREH